MHFAFADEITRRIVDDSPMPLEMQHPVVKRGEEPRYAVESTCLWSAMAVWMASEEHSSEERRQERLSRVMTVVAPKCNSKMKNPRPGLRERIECLLNSRALTR